MHQLRWRDARCGGFAPCSFRSSESAPFPGDIRSLSGACSDHPATPRFRLAFAERQAIACRLSLLVGLGGLEPPTSRLSGVRSNRLSYKPIIPDQVQTLAPAPLDGRSLRRLRALLDPSQEAIPFGSLSRLSRPLRFPPAVSNGRAIASRLSLVVEINGIEPLTSCLQSRRSPS